MKMYTAQEMRVRADYLEGALADEKTAVMLRQAAYNLEREATSEKSSQVGNAAAMRESLDAIIRIDTRMLKRLLCELVEADIFDGGQIKKTISSVEKARRSLSAPPRNCDIGTAEEQEERHNRWCKSMKQRTKCCCVVGCRKCFIEWSQMHYEEVK